MTPIYIRLFNTEIMIEPTSYSEYSYIEESDNERELHIGKVKILISTGSKTLPTKFIWDRFNN